MHFSPVLAVKEAVPRKPVDSFVPLQGEHRLEPAAQW